METIAEIKPTRFKLIYTAKPSGNIVKVTRSGAVISTKFKPESEYVPSSSFIPFRHRNYIIPKASRFLKIMGIIVADSPKGVKVASIQNLKPSFSKKKVIFVRNINK